MSSSGDLLPEALDVLPEVSDFDRRVYQAVCAYAFDEAECHPSQQRVADDLGCSRFAVNRAIQRLIKAGWLKIKERVWSWRSGWVHNVYELLAHYVVGEPTVRRIVRRAHNTPKARQRRLRARLDRPSSRQLHTNPEGVPKGWCSCRWCRPDRASVGRPPPPLADLEIRREVTRREKSRIRAEAHQQRLSRWRQLMDGRADPALSWRIVLACD